MNVKTGDRVLLPGWGGSPIKVGEEVRRLFLLLYALQACSAYASAAQEYHLFKDSEILAKIQE